MLEAIDAHRQNANVTPRAEFIHTIGKKRSEFRDLPASELACLTFWLGLEKPVVA